MEGKMDDKCERKVGWAEKICAQLPEKTDCKQWAGSQLDRCYAYGKCRVSNVKTRGKCMAEFKHRMISFKNDKVVARTEMNDVQIGQCFTTVLQKAEQCSIGAASKYTAALLEAGAVELTDQELELAKAVLKEMREMKKQQRQEKRKAKKQQRKQ